MKQSSRHKLLSYIGMMVWLGGSVAIATEPAEVVVDTYTPQNYSVIPPSLRGINMHHEQTERQHGRNIAISLFLCQKHAIFATGRQSNKYHK